jgi:hypothetical protein
MRVSRVRRVANARGVLPPVLPQDLACAGNPQAGPAYARAPACSRCAASDVRSQRVPLIPWERRSSNSRT